ncbi:gluconate 5-dehydrogenase [Sphingobium faniae]|nr:gluconate 5-dehydrogenase [Sphingobium faniae]
MSRQMTFDLGGKVALVTGGGTGLGYHMARSLMRCGAAVVISARRQTVLDDAIDQLSAENLPGCVTASTVDLSDRSSLAALVEKVSASFGGVDIFAGNAGQDLMEHVDRITDRAFDQMMQVNLSANVELVRAFVPHMRQKRWGRILFSSSAAALCASPHEGSSIYSASKNAINTFARTIATELGHDGITVNSLSLGMFLTDIVRDAFTRLDREQGAGAGDAARDSFASMTALGRLGELPEIEGLIQLLASDAGGYITGSTLAVDGGLSIMLRPNPVTQDVGQ